MAEEPSTPSRRIGRYLLHSEIASGGMGTVHLGRMMGAAGFSRTVAIKRLRSQYAQEPEFLAMFLDEARLASRIAHPNVVQTLDVVEESGEVLVVMEYVHGESLATLLRLNAAHEAVGPDGKPLSLVHRDVSPHNVVVSVDGVARVLDFGVAKATWRLRDTRDGALRGKVAYMAPEQLAWETVDRRADIYAAAIVLWETLTGTRLFKRDGSIDAAARIRGDAMAAPSTMIADTLSEPGALAALDGIALRGLARDPNARFATAMEMAAALESATSMATPREIAAWVTNVAGHTLADRAQRIRELERDEGGEQEAQSAVAGALASAASARRDRDAETRVPAVDPSVDETAVTAAGLSSENAAASRPKRGQSRTARVMVAAVVVTLLVVGFGVMWTKVGSRPSVGLGGVVPGPDTSAAAVAPTSASAVVRDPPAPLDANTSATSSVAATAARPEESDRPHALPSKRGNPRPHAPTRAKGSPNCTPNFTVDADGMKHFKPECF